MTEVRINNPDNLCSLAPRTDLITGFLISALRNHFSRAESIEFAPLRHLIWKAGPNDQLERGSPDSPILIAPVHQFDPNQTEKRPAIFVKDNEERPAQRLSINQEEQGYFDISGDRHFAYMESSSHSLICISSSYVQSKLLAYEVRNELFQFSSEIRKALGLNRFEWVGTTDVRQVEEARENYVSVVTFGYTFTVAFRLRPHSPKLQRIGLSTVYGSYQE